MDARDFLTAIARGVPQTPQRLNRLATIPAGYTSGDPTVVFDGESTPTTKTYKRLASYTPAASDRVLLAPVGTSSYVIIGQVT